MLGLGPPAAVPSANPFGASSDCPSPARLRPLRHADLKAERPSGSPPSQNSPHNPFVKIKGLWSCHQCWHSARILKPHRFSPDDTDSGYWAALVPDALDDKHSKHNEFSALTLADTYRNRAANGAGMFSGMSLAPAPHVPTRERQHKCHRQRHGGKRHRRSRNIGHRRNQIFRSVSSIYMRDDLKV